MDYYMHLAPESRVTLFAEAPIEYASFWDRFLAFFIDVLILIIPNFLLLYAAGTRGALLCTFVVWIYMAIQESGTAQATIGKKALGLQVTTENGKRLSFAQATVRYFGKLISAIILSIGFLMVLRDKKKQTLHDKMARSLVIRES